MIRHLRQIILFILIIPVNIFGQESGSGPGYQLILLSNPGLTGAEGNGFIRLSYLNFYPGNNYNLHSVSLSYDSYFPGLHGGAGFFLTNDYLGGIVNNIKGGFSYAYFFQAGKDLFINAGLSASLYHRGYNFSGAVLPDQIDPLRGVVLSSGELLTAQGKSVLDLGTGFLFIAGSFFGGLSVNHLAEPNLDDSDYSDGRLVRRLLMHAAGEIDLNKERNLKIRPLGKIEIQKGFMSGCAGAVMESKYLSVNSLLFADYEKNIDLQTGFSINTGSLIIYYNYRFNIKSGSNLLPFSLLHHTGIALSLYNVEKRKVLKTINFPKL